MRDGSTATEMARLRKGVLETRNLPHVVRRRTAAILGLLPWVARDAMGEGRGIEERAFGAAAKRGKGGGGGVGVGGALSVDGVIGARGAGGG